MVARLTSFPEALMADDNSDLGDAIESNAEGPRRVEGDMGSVEQHNLKDQIEADKYLAAKQAARKKRRGLRFNKLIPPGSV
jgi:hypothetical protein